jgi:hypothetical protein
MLGFESQGTVRFCSEPAVGADADYLHGNWNHNRDYHDFQSAVSCDWVHFLRRRRQHHLDGWDDFLFNNRPDVQCSAVHRDLFSKSELHGNDDHQQWLYFNRHDRYFNWHDQHFDRDDYDRHDNYDQHDYFDR